MKPRDLQNNKHVITLRSEKKMNLNNLPYISVHQVVKKTSDTEMVYL